MEKINGAWGFSKDMGGDFFLSNEGIEFVFQGEDEDGQHWFRNTADQSADYVHVDDLVDDGSGNPPLLPVINSQITTSGFSSIADLEDACRQAYRLELNPLPVIREMLKGLPLTVNFTYRGAHFNAEPRSAVLQVALDNSVQNDPAVYITLVDQYFDEGFHKRWMQVRLNADSPVSE